MKSFALYTLARLGLFVACFGLCWLVLNIWLDWNMSSALETAIAAMLLSSVVALFALRSLRDGLAADVSTRADRARAAFEARRAIEDADDDAPREPLAGTNEQTDAQPDRVAELEQPGRP